MWTRSSSRERGKEGRGAGKERERRDRGWEGEEITRGAHWGHAQTYEYAVGESHSRCGIRAIEENTQELVCKHMGLKCAIGEAMPRSDHLTRHCSDVPVLRETNANFPSVQLNKESLQTRTITCTPTTSLFGPRPSVETKSLWQTQRTWKR